MKKAFGIAILVIGLSVTAFLGCRIWRAHNTHGDDSLRDNAKMVSAESIFTDDNVVDLGNHTIAYLIPNDINVIRTYGSYLNDFAGDHYIAVQVFYMNSYHDNRDDIVYIPDIYENITEIKLEGSNELYIQYVDAVTGEKQEVCLPIGFVSLIENNYTDLMRFSDHYCRKLVLPEQEGLRSGEAVLPRIVWTETFWAEEQPYEVTFERISLIYEFELETGGIFADYNLTVRDGNGDVINERLFLNYPVVYEAAHWLVDFSGDGFMDIATAYNEGWGMEAGDRLYTLIWNPQKMQYEYKQSPSTSKVEDPHPLWNEELACWIEFADRDREGRLIMDMYSFADGGWKRVRRLQAVYAENEYTADGGPVYLGYQEVFYSEDGEVLEVKMLEENPEVGAIWFDAESIWSMFNTDNLKLYLTMPDWELVETDLSGKRIPLWMAAEDLTQFLPRDDLWDDSAQDNSDTLFWLQEAQLERMEEYHFLSDGETVHRIVQEEYDEAGNQTAYVEYYPMKEGETYEGESPFGIYQYNEVDESGNVIVQTAWRPVKGWEMEYNENGDLTAERFYNPVGLDGAYRYEYQYDAEGKVTVCELYDDEPNGFRSGRLITREEYAYDEYGNLISYHFEENTAEGELWIQEESYEYIYGADGSLKSYIRYYHDNGISQLQESYERDEYECDENGRVSHQNHYYNDELRGKYEFCYDENGNLTVRYTYDSDDRLVCSTVYEYDENGILRAWSDYSYDMLEFRYEYDAMGNKTVRYDASEHISDKYINVYDSDAGTVTIYRYGNGGNKLRYITVMYYTPQHVFGGAETGSEDSSLSASDSEDTYYQCSYDIHTKRYVRHPDGYLVQIEWPRITGTGSRQAYDNINYILERTVFKIVRESILGLKEWNPILQEIATMKDQEEFIYYEIEYQDENIFCVCIMEDSFYFDEEDEIRGYGGGNYYYVFDVNTGKQLQLSDFIEIDRRIVDYVADDYQPTDYNSPANFPSYSFMDAFQVYEDEKYEWHERMSVEEAIEALKDGTIKWRLCEDKSLVLYRYYGSRTEEWVKIPYSYIKEFAYY